MEQQNSSQIAPQINDAEKRCEHRRRALKTGTLIFNKGYASYGCTIRNMNDAGVMVEMGETTGIPQEFKFRMDDSTLIDAQMIWRTKDRIGIQFIN